MKRWEAKGVNNEDITEEDINWDLVKDKVTALKLNNNGQIIKLPDNLKYVQGKTASATIGSGKVQIASRFIGFEIGNNIIKIRVDEQNNNISVEVEGESNNISNSK